MRSRQRLERARQSAGRRRAFDCGTREAAAICTAAGGRVGEHRYSDGSAVNPYWRKVEHGAKGHRASRPSRQVGCVRDDAVGRAASVRPAASSADNTAFAQQRGLDKVRPISFQILLGQTSPHAARGGSEPTGFSGQTGAARALSSSRGTAVTAAPGPSRCTRSNSPRVYE